MTETVALKTLRLWRVAGQHTVREGSIAPSAMKGLHHPRTFALLQWHLQEEQNLKNTLQDLASSMETLVPLVPEEDRSQRQALIRVRRDLLKNKIPRAVDLEVLQGTHPELCQRVQEVANRLQKWLECPLETVLQDEHLQVQKHLKAILKGHPDFLSSLEISVPDVMDAVRDFLNSEEAGKWRKLENTLTTYLSRAAFKTSPLSRFTRQAVHGSGVPEARTQVLLNAALLHRFWKGIQQHPDLKPHLLYRWNPDCTPHEKGFELLLLDRKDGKAADRWMVLPHSALLGWLHQTLQTPHTLLDLLEKMQAVLKLDPARSEGFVLQLLDRQVLVPEFALDDLTPEPVTALQQVLSGLPVDVAQQVSSLLGELQDLLDHYSKSDAMTRRGVQASIQQQVHLIQDKLSLEGPMPDSGRWLYENASASTHLASLPELDQQTINLVHTLSMLLTGAAAKSLKQEESFVQRYGPEGQTSLTAYLLNPLEETPSSAAQDLHHRAQEVSRSLKTLIEQNREAREIQIPAEVLAPHQNSVRRFQPAGWTWLMQQHQSQWVLNTALGGVGVLGLRCLTPSSKALLKTRLERLYAGKAAQLRVTSQSTINHNPVVLDRTLGTLSSLEKSTFRLQDLQVQHVQGQGLQVVDPLGERVIPLYLSTFVPSFLTPTEQRLIDLTPQVGFRSYIVESFCDPQSPNVQHFPRLKLGEVVVSREAWVVPSEGLIRQKNETEVEHWRRVLALWQSHGLPERFFLSPNHTLFEEKLDIVAYFSKERQLKPQFIDLQSLLYMRLLERWARDCPATLLYEAFPDPFDQNLVQEIAVELEEHHA